MIPAPFSYRRAGTVEESVRRALASQSRAKIAAAADVLAAIARELEPDAERAKPRVSVRPRRALGR